MHDAIPLPNLSSCFALQIRAKLKRRVHWFCCVCFHIHNMPMSVRFFKPPLTSFHRLVGFYLMCHDGNLFTFFQDYCSPIVSLQALARRRVSFTTFSLFIYQSVFFSGVLPS